MKFTDLFKTIGESAATPFTSVVQGAAKIIDAVVEDPNKKREAIMQLQLLEAQERQQLREFQIKQIELFDEHVRQLREQIKLELASEDPFVRRQRPAWGYASLLLVIWNFMIRPLWAEPVDFPEMLWMLLFGINGLYFFMRSRYDKRGELPPWK